MSQAENIASVFDDWLKAEVVTSGESRNKYLDPQGGDPEKIGAKFRLIRAQLAKPYDDDKNWAAQKDKSHQQQRVPLWAEFFEATAEGHSEADWYAAQAMFAPLMTVSGSYRTECYLSSYSAEDYTDLRARGIGIDIEEAVSKSLEKQEVKKSFTASTITFSGLKRAYDYAYAQTEANFRALSARIGRPSVGYDPYTRSIQGMRESQFRHIQLATDCVIMAAKLRHGELEAVPFLEPVSITDQSRLTHYPLHEPVNWLEVLRT